MIIMISGKAESGKTTLSNYITELSPELVGHLTFQMSFGNEVKRIARQIGWDGEKDERGRNLLQWLGNGVRGYNKDTWVNRLLDNIDAIEDYNVDKNLIVIDDARYQNEIKEFKGCHEVISVRIERPNHSSALTEEQKRHPSETELDDYKFDYYIINDGTKEDLLKKAVSFLKDVYDICPR